ncbi:SDR family NAD(P)-dependent oxidoreductase [Streptomyces sp. NPDC059142]|uniref:SDR family NAD(P)-dependent oxidoreductase n=1 Tax=Streptomyces sp. NPDC059142 TaxID=3346739 RepID=UPI003673A1DC
MLSPGSRVEAEVALEPTDFVVHEHRLRDVCLLPGSALFDVIWRMLEARGLDPARAVLTRVLFAEPVTTAPGIGRELRVVFEADDTGRVGVRVTSRPVGELTLGAPWVENLRAQLDWSGRALPGLAPDVRDAADATGDMAQVYGRARAQQVHHGPRMACTGTVRRGPGGLLAEIDLGTGAGSEDFYLHPARLDAATLLGFCQTPPEDDPFVPMFVSRFRAVRPLRGPALVHVPEAERLTDSGELLSNDVRIYDLDGEPIAEIVGFASKRLRPGAAVSAPEAPVPVAPERAPVPAVSSAVAPEVGERRATPVSGAMPDRVRAVVAGHLGRPASDVPTGVGFYELGLNSVDVLRIAEQLEEVVGSTLYPTMLFEHTTVDAVAAFLVSEYGETSSSEDVSPDAETGSAEAAPGTGDARLPGELVAFEPVWTPAPAPVPGHGYGDIVVFGAAWAQALRAARPDRRVVTLVQDGPAPAGGYVVDQWDRADLTGLLHRMASDGIEPSVFIDATWPAPAPYPRLWALASALVDSRRPGPHRLLVVHGPNADAGYQALGALLRTLGTEVPALRCRVVALPTGTPDAAVLLAEADDLTDDVEVHHLGGRRLVRRHRPVPLPPPERAPIRRGGSYLVAGAGRIGLHVANWLAREYGAELTLAARRPEPPETSRLLAEWRELGVTARYVRAELTSAADVARLTEAARRTQGRLDGVFQCAGAVEDAVFFRKRPERAAAVLAAKIDAVTLLDEATSADDLGLFVAFSSLAATLPSPGQCDYAYANAALGALMRRRTGPGRSLAVEWPYWSDGGMTAPADALRHDRQTHGLAPMPTAAGLRALGGALASGASHLLIGYGEPDRIAIALGTATEPGSATTATSGTAPTTGTAAGTGTEPGAPSDTDLVLAPAAPPAEARGGVDDDAIAVIGMAGRYPQAADVAEFWRNLSAGRDCITEVPADRWPHEQFFDPRPNTPGRTYGKWGGFLDGIDRFDRAFFGISRREAERMDPQERLFLTTAWQTVEDAGYRPDQLTDRSVGVFVGVMSSHFQLVDAAPDEPLPLALHSSVANRVSYRMDLRGPSMAIDTACSSSLTAIHLAVQAIRSGECTWALAGGVNVMPHPEKYLQLAAGQWLSRDGRCRSFGEGGTGYVPGEGVGALLLKPLAAARADGDHVYGVIRGSRLNHGGRASGFTVPSPGAQTDVVTGALTAAGVDPATVNYVEAHGTGTSLGDPIEVQGLRDAYTGVDTTCALGSVKSVIGHLESAAGVAAVTKVLLQLRHHTLAPTLHCDEVNPALRIDESPFRLQRTAEPWQPGAAGVRRAGVSSFGAGGSNAHLVLEEAPPPRAAPVPAGPAVLVLSAEDEEQLARVVGDLLAVLEQGDEQVRHAVAGLLGVQPDDVSATVPLRDLGLEVVDLELLAASTGLRADELARRTLDELAPGEGAERLHDLAYTSQVGRTPRAHRLAVVCADSSAARRALRAHLAGEAPPPGAYWGREPGADPAGLDDAVRERQWDRLAEAWAAGVDVPWHRCHPAGLRRVPLPPYPFRGERCWPGLWRAENAGGAETAAVAGTPAATQATAVPGVRARAGTTAGRQTGARPRVAPNTAATTGVTAVTDTAAANGGAPEPPRAPDPDPDRPACETRLLPDGILLVTLGRSTFTDELLDGFREALVRAAADEAVSCVVITGSGEVFSMGATPEAMARLAAKQGTFADVSFLHQLVLACDKPVVSALQGHASGGGLVFGLYADVVVMAREASYGVPFLTYGFTPGAGATFFVERKLGTAVAEQLFYTGRTLTGAELRERGASVDIRPRADVLPTALGYAQSIVRQSRTAAAELKRELAGRTLAALSDVIERELRMHERVLGGEAVERVQSRLGRESAPSPTAAATAPAAQPVSSVPPHPPVPSVPPAPHVQPVPPPGTSGSAGEELRDVVVEVVAAQLYLAPHEVDPRQTFSDMGLDSIGAVEVTNTLASRLGVHLESVLVYERPTVPELADAVAEAVRNKQQVADAAVAPRAGASEPARPAEPVTDGPAPSPVGTAAPAPATAPLVIPVPAPVVAAVSSPEPGAAVPLVLRGVGARAGQHAAHAAPAAPGPVGTAVPAAFTRPAATVAPDPAPPPHDAHAIAVIGMSGQFPHAPTLEAFWAALVDRRQHTEEVPAERWDTSVHYDPAGPPGTTTSKWAASLSGIDRFDAPFFRMSPLEAEDMDPEQRLFLTESWRALEDAGYAVGPDTPTSCGVFVGCTQSDYRHLRRAAGRHDTAHSFLGGAPSVLAARVSYFLNLTGPTAAVDSACSSSLLAVHLACQSILSGDCEMAVAGGVALMLGPDIHVQTSAAGILSPTGRSAPFDASADGIVLGEGVGAVVLKPLARALADGDHVHGVIRAGGANGDGRSNGIAAPSGRAQADLLTRVWRRAGITPDEIGLIEAHGTGTPLGDPIEAKALAEAFTRTGSTTASCALGSVKGNFGHTTMAAGIASLLKVLLALRHKQLPPTAGFASPNPRLDLDDSPFQVVTEVRDWPPGPSGQRIAAVSSFGVSGTNCHLVVAEGPARPRHLGPRSFVVPVSARTPRELGEQLGALAEAAPSAPELADVAYTLCFGRRHHPARAVVVADSLDDLAVHLRAAANGAPPSLAAATPEQRRLADEYLAGGSPAFGTQFHGIEARRTPLPPHPLRGTRYWPKPPAAPATAPAAGLTWWVAPDAWQVADHRIGDTPVLPGTGALALAAVAAGDDGTLEMSGVRWLQPLRAGTAQEVRVEMDGSRFSLRCAGTDFATGTVRPAPAPAAPLPVDDIARRCTGHRSGKDLYTRFATAGLHYGPAYQVVDEVWVGDGEALGRLTVAERSTWSSVVDVAALDGAVQVASVLAGEGELLLPFAAARVVVRPADGAPTWAHVSRTPEGITVRLAGADGWEHARIEGLVAREARTEHPRPARAGQYGEVAAPGQSPRTAPEAPSSSRTAGAGEEDGGPAVSVLVPTWTSVGEGDLSPAQSGRALVLHTPGAEPLARELAARCGGELLPLAAGPDRLARPDLDSVHVVATGDSPADPDEDPTLAQVFDCVRVLAQGPAARRPLNLTAVLEGVLPAGGRPVTAPARAGILGVLRAAGAEHPHWQVRGLDLGDAGVEALLRAPAGHPAPAWRDGRWLTRVFRPLTAAPTTARLPQAGTATPGGPASPASPWRDRGVHLIAGGAGGIGFALSLYLARHTSADLVWLGRRPADAEVAARLAEVEAAGGRVRYVRGDVAEPRDVRAALAVAHTEFGPVTCAVHAALELRDRTLAFADADDLRATLRPKARGVRVLHDVLRDEPLDHFVLFSSAASAIDSPGQAAYAAASSVEDALGQALHAAGPVPVTVVNWGYWGSVGVVAAPERARIMAAAGVGSVEPADGFAALGQILTARVPQALVARATPEALSRLGVTVREPAEDSLESLAGALLAAELTAAGVLPAPGAGCSATTMAERLGVVPAHRRLFDALLPILERAGAVRCEGADLIGLGGTGPAGAPARPHASVEAQEQLLRRCVAALPEVLAGRRNPLEVLFPGGSTDLLARFYGGGAAERAANQELAARVRSQVDACGPGARVLEIGAGTGATTRHVLAALDGAAPVEYVFTDLSASFLRQGEQALRAHAPDAVTLRYARFDAEREPAVQGFGADHDAVVVAGVLHATSDVTAALRHAAELLRPGGLLLVHETTGRSDFLTLTFGLTEGWWRYQDPELRQPHSPLLTPGTWHAVAGKAGLTDVEVTAAAATGAAGPCLLTARREPAAVTPDQVSTAPDPAVPTPEAARHYVRAVFAEVLRHDPEDLGDHAAFDDFGIDSLVSLTLIGRFEADLGALPSTLLFEHLTIAALADHLRAMRPTELAAATGTPRTGPGTISEVRPDTGTPSVARTGSGAALVARTAGTEPASHDGAVRPDDIAIVGVSGRYPGAPDLDAFWRLLSSGGDAVTEVPEDRFDWREYYDARPGTQNRLYTARGGFIEGVDRFDPGFFGILAREAVKIDPQERLFLETCWDLLERTGNLGDRATGRTGVFAGAMYGTYGQLAATAWPQGEMTGAHSSYWSIANRVSYLLDLSGPSYAVDSACSSSLTALHLACESLRRGECDTAIAGGVNVIIHPAHFVSLCSMTMLSPHGICRVFDAEADGFVPGEGVGAVLLKPLSRAIADGDDIWAVVKGSAVNAGGRTSGYTVPNPNAQAAVITQALERAGVDPATVDYVEAHGTGTALGDPIEMAGLRRVFDRVAVGAADGADARADARPLAVGSVKANVGHLEAAAGIAGLTKVLLQLRHRAIAPCAHLREINPRIDVGDRLDLPRELRRWEAGASPRRAGISSFGAGGANAHVVIEEYVPARPDPVGPPSGDQLFVLSARSPELLAQYAGDVAAALGGPLPVGAGLPGLAHTSQVGRPALRERLAVLCGSVPELVTRLTSVARGESAPGVWRGSAAPGRETAAAREAVAGGPDDTAVGPAAERWADAARRWTGGERVDWAALWPVSPRAAAFPGHPQRRRRIWWEPATPPPAAPVSLPATEPLPEGAPLPATASVPVTAPVPLSVLGETVRGHHVGGRRILPGAAVPQLVHAALPGLSGAVRFGDLTWQWPLDLDRITEVRVVAGAHRPDEPVPFTLTGPDGVAYATGTVEPLPDPALPPGTAPAPGQVGPSVAPAVVYARLSAGGVRHDGGLQVLRALWAGPGECLADVAASPAPGLWLDPAVLDGALQALAVLDDANGYLPTSCAELTSVRPLPARCRVHARDVTPDGATGFRIVDLDIYDGEEQILVLRGLRLTAVRTEAPRAAVPLDASVPAAVRSEAPAPYGGVRTDHAPSAGATARESAPVDIEIRHRRPRWRPAGPPEPGRPLRRVLLHCPEPALRADLAAELDLRGIAWDVDADAGPGAVDAVLHVCPASAPDLTTQLREGFDTTLRLATSHLGAARSRTPLRMLVAHHIDERTGQARPAYAALGALLRTISLEHTDFSGVQAQVEGAPAELARLLVEELLGAGEGDVRHTATQRYVREFEDYEPPSAAQAADPALFTGPARTYLITGGAGRIGTTLARHLAVRGGPVNLVLCGRRAADAAVTAALRDLSATGAEVIYHQADVSDRRQVDALVATVRQRFGALHGVVHAAGVTRDSLAVRKTPQEVAEVLAPKVWGVVHLDAATRDEPLEFLALFSSVAATTGNLGQADYAFANAFLDAFADERAARHRAGRRPGRTVSIGWPLWSDSGMLVDEASRTLMAQHTGMVPLPGADALRSYDAFLAGDETCPGVVSYAEGLRPRSTRHHTLVPDVAGTAEEEPTAERTGSVERELRSVAAGFLMVPDDDVDTGTDLMELGFDSISLTELITKVNARYGLDLLPTVLFEAPTLEALAERLVREHLTVGRVEDVPERALSEASAASSAPAVSDVPGESSVSPVPAGRVSGRAGSAMPVAIVGMAGRFPGSDDLAALWRTVSAGRDQVGPVPADRAELLADPRMAGVRAGFLERVAEFDAAAFGISPREAGYMDPQQRHFLEVTWQALYDAGRRPGELAGSATGVFVGVATGDYNELMTAYGGAPEAHMATGVAHAVLANRVSHLLDLHGPSEALDTACSSSLVAVHHAVRALQNGDCDLAIAGGVNLTLSPALFATFTRAGMLSPRGRCASFDDSADGYVRGEGVGAVVLKPLDRARADGDHVHAVILGSAVNHCGRTPSLTAPNPTSQADVVVDAVRAAGVDPRTIGFVQAHGTGTPLGDPIEIEGLKQAYARLYEDWNLPAPAEPHVAVGSVKANIGHLEAAAGIVGLLTTVLAMRGGLVPPQPHLREPNHYLRLGGTPLTLADGARRWDPVTDESGQPVRRAGVSSFGFGGSNAHVVLQVEGAAETRPPSTGGPWVVPVSARDAQALADYRARLADFLDRTPAARLDQVAYTLQVGREELPHRLAVVVRDRAQLVAALRGTSPDGVHLGVATARPDGARAHVTPEELAAAWCDGHAVDWAGRWPAVPGRTPLPGPGFSRVRHWFPRPAQPLKGSTDTITEPDKTSVEAVETVAVPVGNRSETRQAAPAAVATTSVAARASTASVPSSLSSLRSAEDANESVQSAPARRAARGQVRLAPVHRVDAPRPPSPRVGAPEPSAPAPARAAEVTAQGLRERVAVALGLPAEEIGDHDSLTSLGLDSIMRVELVRWLHDKHGTTLPTSELYEHDTLSGLARYLGTVGAPDPAPAAPDSVRSRPEAESAAVMPVQPVSAPQPVAADAVRQPIQEAALMPDPATPVPAESTPAPAAPDAQSEADAEPDDLAAVVRRAVERAVQKDLGPDGRFTDGSLTSLDMLRAVRALEKVLGTLPKTLLFDRPDCVSLADHLAGRFGAPAVARLGEPPAPAAPAPRDIAHTGAGARVVVPRSELADRPDLLRLVRDVEEQYGMETGLAGLSIAPLLFFPATRDGYLAIGRRDDSVLVWRYTGAPEQFASAAGELLAHCRDNGLRLNLLSTEPLTELAGTPMLATAFGVVQRLQNLDAFSLDGGRRSKLRYLVNRFRRDGDNRVGEYVSGSDPATDEAIAGLVDQWSEGKQMVNAYVAEARELIRAGKLPDRHRIFLTYRDQQLLSAIVLAALPAEKGYLLDVEFYPRSMPLGGLEYSLVEIVGRLAAEGAEVLSFGGSFGVEVTTTPNPAEDVRQALAELRSVGIFDEGNYRFKKKFGPVEVPLYLCQPAANRTDAVDLITMIANSEDTAATSPEGVDTGTAGTPGSADHEAPPGAPVSDRAAQLARVGHNPVLLDHAEVEFDLLTDSWFERTDAFVTDRMAALAARVADPGSAPVAPPAWMPLSHVSWTASGRSAELRLCRSWPGRRGVVLHNDLFPTWQFALAEAGFTAVRTPRPDGAAHTGDARLARLAALLDEYGADVSFVCLELSTNAAGGLPLTLGALREAARTLHERGVPLVLDATRMVDNAWAAGEAARVDLWQTVRDQLDTADAVTVSLSKNFAVGLGGLVATRRSDLAERMAEDEDAYGRQLGRQQQAVLGAALADTPVIGELVHRRGEQVRSLHQRLVEAGAPVHGGPGAHCVLLDPRRDDAFGGLAQPGPAMLAWLYRATGVRGGPHLGDDPAGLLRLAVPTGLSDADAKTLTDRLASCFVDRSGVVDLHPTGPVDSPMALARARFEPADRIPDDVRAAVAAGYAPAGDNLAVLNAHAPAVQRHLVELETATVEAFVHGTGPTLLLMHPFNIGAGMFARQFAELGADHRLVVLHHPGVGATRTRGQMSLDHIVDLCTEALERLGIDGPLHLAGASWGALVAQTFALRHPGRVASLTTIGGSYRYANRVGEVNRLEVIVAEDMAAVAAATGDEARLPDLAAELLRCESMDPYVGLSYLDLFADEPDLLRRLPELDLPAAVIQGRLDCVVPLDTARKLAAAIAGARYEELADAGHFPCVTHADEISRLLREVVAASADREPHTTLRPSDASGTPRSTDAHRHPEETA